MPSNPHVVKDQKKDSKGAVKAALVVTPLADSQPIASPTAPAGNELSGSTTPHTP